MAGGGFVQAASNGRTGRGRGRRRLPGLDSPQPPARGRRFPPRAARAGAAGRGGWWGAGAGARGGGAGGGEGGGAGRAWGRRGAVGPGRARGPGLDPPPAARRGGQEGSRRFPTPTSPARPRTGRRRGSPRAASKKNRRLGEPGESPLETHRDPLLTRWKANGYSGGYSEVFWRLCLGSLHWGHFMYYLKKKKRRRLKSTYLGSFRIGKMAKGKQPPPPRTSYIPPTSKSTKQNKASSVQSAPLSP